MKVYIVTTGCYSDYCIDRVFTDRAKAEEYRKWCYDANDVEEYDTSDDYHVNKYYKIWVTYRVNDDGNNQKPHMRIETCCNPTRNFTSVNDYHKYGGKYIDLTLVRYIPESNWNEEFYRNKYIKAIYDLAATARQLSFEGFTNKQINEIWEQTISD